MEKKLYQNCLVLFVAIILILFPCTAFGAIRVVAESGTDPAVAGDVQKTVDLYNQLLNEDMKVTLKRDVRLFICPTKENYEVVLQHELRAGSNEAERLAEVSGGLSKGSNIALNGSTAIMKSPQGRTSVTGHELFHQIQNQLAGDQVGKSFKWLREGTADLIGARICEQSGFQSMEKWKLDRINVLHNATAYASPFQVVNTDMDQWIGLMEKKLYPYEMSDLMVFYLQQQVKGNSYEAIATYFRLIGNSVSNEQAFEQAFGIKTNQFLSGFGMWFLENRIQSAHIEFIPSGAVADSSAADIEQATELTRQFFQDKWGGDLESSMRILLVEDKASYAAAMVKEFGITPSEAAQIAKNGSWRYSGSTGILDIGSMPSRKQRIYNTANLFVRKFQDQTAPQQTLASLTWLVNGSSDAVATKIVEVAGASSGEEYQRLWLGKLGKASALPDLTELQTKQGWADATNKYGAGIKNDLSAIATLYLAEKQGFESLHEWMKTAKMLGDGEQAFTKVYGMSSAQFAAEFKNYLSAKLGKSD